MKPVVTIRPEPGASATAAAGKALGLNMIAQPMWQVGPQGWDCPDPAAVDGLLIGSANALRHGGPQMARMAGMPVHAVGQATAALAADMGYAVASTGPGTGTTGLQGVIDALPAAPIHLLRLAGEEHVPLAVPAHVTITTCMVYTTTPLPMSDELAQILRDGAVVLLHSAVGASHFCAEADRLKITRSGVAIAALAPRIAAAAGSGWAACRSASTPDDRAILALAAEMCQ